MKLTPYLLFDGTCAPAMLFYHACLGGELSLTRVSESPIRDHMPPALQEKVLNGRLQAPGLDISASDWMRAGRQPVQGNTVCLYFSGGTREELRAAFDRLADGGDVTDPLSEMPIGLYGALNDRFGVRWMFHAE